MDKKYLVLILYGGSSLERDVSFMSADKIFSNINYDKYDVIKMEIPNNTNKWVCDIININPDIVFIALHGGIGENGALQGLLECLNIPYIGSNIMSSAICMNKYISKNIMRYNYIPVIDDMIIYKNENYVDFIDKILQIGYPLVVKPNNGGSSIGINVVYNDYELSNAIGYVKNVLCDDILIEKFISGKEITCFVYEKNGELNFASIFDICKKNDFYDYNDKYKSKKSCVDISTLPIYMQDMIKEISKKVFLSVNAKDYACIDMIVYEEQVYVIEINTLPGMTYNSILTKTFESGINDLKSFSDFIDLIIENNI